MQCKEFREISEAYLSDELLVETNIQVFRHLEHCPKCREEFAAKRELRQKICSAIKNADDFQIDPVFVNHLSANLKKTALYKSTGRNFWFAPNFLIPVMSSLLIAVTLGFAVFNWSSQNGGQPLADDFLTKGLTQISIQAVVSHKHCALEKLKKWEEISKQDFIQKAVYTEQIAKPLQTNFSKNIEMLHAHDCIFNGKRFTHIILRKGSNIVSVFLDKSDAMPETDNSTTAKIICEKENGLQVASFQKNKGAIFVISDMSETENLSAARALSNSWQNIQS